MTNEWRAFRRGECLRTFPAGKLPDKVRRVRRALSLVILSTWGLTGYMPDEVIFYERDHRKLFAARVDVGSGWHRWAWRPHDKREFDWFFVHHTSEKEKV